MVWDQTHGFILLTLQITLISRNIHDLKSPNGGPKCVWYIEEEKDSVVISSTFYMCSIFYARRN